MAEETQETATQGQEPVAQQQAPVQQPAPSSFKMPSGLGQMLKGNDRKAFEEVKAKFEAATTTEQPAAPTAEPVANIETPAAAAPAQQAAKPEPATPAAPTTEKKTVIEERDVFGLNKKKGETPLIGSEKELLDVINKSFGQDLKELKDTGKFLENSVKDWRTKAQLQEETAKKLKETEDALVALPEPIIESMKAFYNNEDYTKPFADRPNFDFDKPVDKQDKVELIKHYFPKQYAKLTEDEIAEIKEGVIPDVADPIYAAATEKFKTAQEARNNQRATQLQRAKDAQIAYKQSVSSSVDYLKQTFPDMDATTINELQPILAGGQQEILKFFLNSNGTLKKEAAEYLMMAKHGKSEMQRLAKISAHAAETKANEEILTRGADSPKPKKTGNASDGAPKISKEAQALIDRAGQTGSGNRKVF